MIEQIWLSFVCGAAFIGGAVAVVGAVCVCLTVARKSADASYLKYYTESLELHRKQVETHNEILATLQDIAERVGE